MRFGRIRFWAAALVAFLLGFPLAAQASAQSTSVSDILDSSLNLGLAIADSAGNS